MQTEHLQELCVRNLEVNVTNFSKYFPSIFIFFLVSFKFKPQFAGLLVIIN